MVYYIKINKAEERAVAFTYKKLFKLLIDRNMKKKDLCELAGICTTSVTKLGKDQNVNTEILEKICDALDCDISDIVEVIPKKNLSEGEDNE